MLELKKDYLSVKDMFLSQNRYYLKILEVFNVNKDCYEVSDNWLKVSDTVEDKSVLEVLRQTISQEVNPWLFILTSITRNKSRL